MIKVTKPTPRSYLVEITGIDDEANELIRILEPHCSSKEDKPLKFFVKAGYKETDIPKGFQYDHLDENLDEIYINPETKERLLVRLF